MIHKLDENIILTLTGTCTTSLAGASSGSSLNSTAFGKLSLTLFIFSNSSDSCSWLPEGFTLLISLIC